MLLRLDFNPPQDETHVTDLVRSIRILTEDQDAQTRFSANQHAIKGILQLCIHTQGSVQERILKVVERMCKVEHEVQVFLENNIFETLHKPEMLYRSSTPLIVRHVAALLINQSIN